MALLRRSTTLLTKICRSQHSPPFARINHAWEKEKQIPDYCLGDASGSGKGLVLGLFTVSAEECESADNTVWTATAGNYNQVSCQELYKQLKASGGQIPLGEARAFFNVEPSFPVTVLVGLGNQCYGYNRVEQRDEAKEAVRIAVGAGVKALQKLNVGKIYVESFGITAAAAEGAGMGLWVYQDLKNKHKRIKIPHLGLYDDCDWTAWQVGLEKAASQNLARQLMSAPSNLTTPLLFTGIALDELCKSGVSAEIRVEKWIMENKMEAFLAVSKGSIEQPIFLELQYNGCDPCLPPIVLVGKGVTYDSGGLCLKRNQKELLLAKGDMAGAATVLAAMRAVAALNLPVNIRGLIPLCENMPGSGAFKPGDIVRAMNGKNILVKNTDFEGWLVLADALSYAQKYKPKFIIDVATLTKESQYLMGTAATTVFTNDDNLWTSLKAASIHTGDRVWRLPFWNVYNEHIENDAGDIHMGADLINSPTGSQAYTASAAAFLSHFICYNKWMHLDTYNVLWETGETTYLSEGMSGRPTRTLIEMLAMMACKPTDC